MARKRPGASDDARPARRRRHPRDPPARCAGRADRRLLHAGAGGAPLPAADPARRRLRGAVDRQLPQVAVRSGGPRRDHGPQGAHARRQPSLVRRLPHAGVLQGQGARRSDREAPGLPPARAGRRRADQGRLPEELVQQGQAGAVQAVPGDAGHPARSGRRAGGAQDGDELRQPHPHAAPRLSRAHQPRARARLHERGHAGGDGRSPRVPAWPDHRPARSRAPLGKGAARSRRQAEHRGGRQGPRARQGHAGGAHPGDRAPGARHTGQQPRPLHRREAAARRRRRLSWPGRSGGGDGGEDGLHPRHGLPPVVRLEQDVGADQPGRAEGDLRGPAQTDAEPGDERELPPGVDVQDHHLVRRLGERRDQPGKQRLLRRQLHHGQPPLALRQAAGPRLARSQARAGPVVRRLLLLGGRSRRPRRRRGHG